MFTLELGLPLRARTVSFANLYYSPSPMTLNLTVYLILSSYKEFRVYPLLDFVLPLTTKHSAWPD